MAEALVEIEGVSKSYGESAQVLDGVDMRVAAGESVAVVGPSGSGKSTLLNLAGALDAPTSGRVRLGGRELAGLREAELASIRAREVGWIFQAHHLLPHCTVLENVLMPVLATGARRAGPEHTRRAMQLLERVGIGELAGRRPGQISSGECQRAAAVRALINGPRLLLADEPTGALDAANAAALVDLLIELNTAEGCAMIVVTHAPDVARRMGRVFELKNGRLTQTVAGK